MGDNESFRSMFPADLWAQAVARCLGSLQEVQRVDGLSALSTVGEGILQRGGKGEHFPFPSFPWGAEEMGVLCSGAVSSPRRLTAPRVSKEDSLAEPRPGAGELEQHSHLWDCLLLHAHTESSSLHTQDTELFLTGHITCVPTGHLQELISSFLSFSPSSIPILHFNIPRRIS